MVSVQGHLSIKKNILHMPPNRGISPMFLLLLSTSALWTDALLSKNMGGVTLGKKVTSNASQQLRVLAAQRGKGDLCISHQDKEKCR